MVLFSGGLLELRLIHCSILIGSDSGFCLVLKVLFTIANFLPEELFHCLVGGLSCDWVAPGSMFVV